jgi:hypothetical protein
VKHNVRKIPTPIKSQLRHLDRYVVAACTGTYDTAQIVAGKLKHLGIRIAEGRLTIPEAIVPLAARGKYSRRNVNGYQVIRKDLGKQTHYHSVETPNWGDFSRGTHDVDLPYEAYPRDFHGPQHMRIKISAPAASSAGERILIVFEVDRILDQKSKDFDRDLLECLNLLQENVGACGVQRAGATPAEYLQTIRVSWEILPPGTVEEVLNRIFRGRSPALREVEAVTERYNFLMSLKPENLICGTSGFLRYFGALIHNDLVVFENIEYGNAIYVMFDDWESLSQRTRTELLSGRYGDNFDRVLHVRGWKRKVREIINQYGGQRPKTAKENNHEGKEH